MASFKDAAGRTWSVTLDAPRIREVRSECKIDPLDFRELERLADDEILIVDVLWVLCRGQHGITDIEFGESLVGDPIQDATDALIQAIADFFPARKRLPLLSLAKKNAVIRDMATSEIMKQLESPNLESDLSEIMAEMMRAEMKKAMTRLRTVTNSPGSSEYRRMD